MRRQDLEDIYHQQLVSAVQSLFPVEGKNRVLEAKRVWIEPVKDPMDFEKLKKVRLEEKTWSEPLKAELVLRDKKTGRVISKKVVQLAAPPKLTPTRGFIVNGKEYQLTNQFLLRPGIYNRIREDGSLSSEYHIKGKSFEVRFDPQTKKFYTKVGGAKPDLYPILKSLGVTDKQLEQLWGKDILEANKKYRKSSLTSFVKSLTGKAPANDMQATQILIERFRGTELDPVVTKLTTGREFTNVSPEALLTSTEELLKLSRGHRKPDSRESLVFKRLRTPGHIVADSVKEAKRKLQWKIKNNVDRYDDPQRIVPKTIDSVIKSTISNSSLSMISEQINPMDYISNSNKTTVMGEGGISSTHAIADEVKLVHPSHLGFLDPLYTPEDAKAGVTLTLAEGAVVKGDQPATVLWNVKKKTFELVTPRELIGKVVAYPDQVKFTGSDVKPISNKVDVHDIHQGTLPEKVDWKKVDYAMVDPVLAQAATTAMIPAVNTVAAVRGTMATRQVTQAVPLKEPEPPLVRSRSKLFGTMENIIGKTMAISAQEGGTVVKVTDGDIVIRTDKGKLVHHKLPRNYPLNGDKSFLDSKPLVKPGMKVKKGQVIADTNFTSGGVAALGKNLTVAYMPFKGLTFEDAVVVSESAAKKLTSVHLHKKAVDVGKTGKLSKKGFQAYYPNMLSKDNADKLDDDGVIKPGTVVKPGEVLVAALREAQPTTETEMLRKLSRSLIKPYSSAAVVWDKDYPGVVTDVVKKGGKVRVYVKTEQPLTAADKIVGRFANKGIVTMVVPDHEMPRTKDGKPVDVIMNPIGVPGRINPAQLFETVAAKIADKTGKPFEIESFPPGDVSVIDLVQKEAAKHRVPVTEPVYDPKTGKELGKALVGKQYIYKLKHMVETKATARSGGVGYKYSADNIPKGGGPTGAKSLGNLGVYAALAHGLPVNLQEMHTWKMDMDQAEQLWTAVQKGLPPPAPQPTFAYQKFVNLLRAAGVDVRKDGNTLTLVPMTDKEVKQLATGIIKDPGKVVKAQDPTKPEKGGLFDPSLTGGLGGDRWAAIKLAEPMPNPLFEKGIRTLLDMTQREFEDLVSGKKGIDAAGNIVSDPDKAKYVGGKAVKKLLENIDLDKEIRKLKQELPHLRRDQLDKAHKKLKYLENLKKHKLSPAEAYTMELLPVLPPKFRPLTVDQNGDIIRDGLNDLYKGVGLINKQLEQLKGKLPESEMVDLRKDSYDALKAYMGLGTHPQLQYKGIISIISGKTPKGKKLEGQPKTGYFQKKLIGARQDMSMYSTITPDPQLSLDEVGLPKPLALKVYEPFVVRKLTQIAGVTPLKAKKMIKEGDPLVDSALNQVVSERPVLLKRDPVLHRYGLMAFKPKITSGKTIKIHPLVTGGFNADFDGDSVYGRIILLDTRNGVSYGESRTETDGGDTMAHEGKLMALDVIDIKDFPHTDIVVKETDTVVEYVVPEGIFVPAYRDGSVKLMPVTRFSIHKDCEKWVVQTKLRREIICSGDHSLAVFDPDTFSLIKSTPRQAKNGVIPIVGNVDDDDEIQKSIPLPDYKIDIGAEKVDIPLSEEFGWMIGALVGDGWISSRRNRDGTEIPNAVHFSYGRGKEAPAHLMAIYAEELFSANCGTTELPHKFEGKNYTSYRLNIFSSRLATLVEKLIGRGASNKHLPPNFLQYPEDFRRGLFIGLIDSDGSINVSKGRLNAQYTSISRRLAEQVLALARSLGIDGSISEYTNRNKPAYAIHFSANDIVDAGKDWLAPVTPAKAAAISEYAGASKSIKDLVPVPEDVRDQLVGYLKELNASVRPPRRDKDAFTRYVILRRLKYDGSGEWVVARMTAQDIVLFIRSRGLEVTGRVDRWFRKIVLNKSLRWDQITSVENTGEKMTMYDLTVPDSWTFTMANGAIVWDTMSAFVPVSTDAVKEAYKALPSRNLFSVATGQVMYTPTKEMLVGLYLASKPGKKTNKKYKTYKEAEAAVKRGEIKYNDVVTIGGKKTTVASYYLKTVVPSDVWRKYDGKVLGKKEQQQLYTDLAKKHPEQYSDVINKVKDLANEFMYDTAFSFDLKDFEPDRALRQKYMSTAKKLASKAKTEEQRFKIYDKVLSQGYKELVKKKEKNPDNLFHLTLAGVKPGPDQYRQLVFAPGLVKNPDGSINPRVIEKTYSEGLAFADYWTALGGARRGIILKVQSVQDPGALTKQMMNSVLDQVVVDDDPDPDFGISMDVSDKTILNRVLAKDVKIGKKTIKAGTIITPEIQSRLRSNKIGKVVVFSPLRSVHGPDGISAKAFGLTTNGEFPQPGENIGVTAAQALGERSIQVTLKAFHGGGVVPYGSLDKQNQSQIFDQMIRLQQLLNVPKTIPNAAPLAKKDGIVEAINPDPAGGWRVRISGEDHYIPASLGKPVLVRRGKKQPLRPNMKVSKGDALADGPINPHQLLELKGIEPVQRYLADEIYKIFEPHGVDKRHVEVVVGAMTNTAIVEDPGDVPGFVRGDPIRLTTALWYNKNLPKGAKKMKIAPKLRGVEVAPFDLTQDWLALLNHQRLSDTIIEAAQQGWVSDIEGPHPIPPLVTGNKPLFTGRKK